MSLSDAIRKVREGLPAPITPRPAILLCPNTPKPMHGVVPREILGTAWWNATRKSAYASTNSHCAACGAHKTQAKGRQWMEGHEWYKIDYRKGRMWYIETLPLCHFCHAYIHDGRLQMLLEKGQIHHAKYVAIVQHGDKLLLDAGLGLRKPYDGPFAEWHKWRLILNRKSYPPKYKTFQEWVAAHA